MTDKDKENLMIQNGYRFTHDDLWLNYSKNKVFTYEFIISRTINELKSLIKSKSNTPEIYSEGILSDEDTENILLSCKF